MAKKKTTKQSSAKNPSTTGAPDVASMQFWLSVARELLPKEKDDWKLMEVAVTLRLQTGLLKQNWDEINRIAGKTEDKVVISWSHKVDRSTAPPTVKVGGSYSEKHPMNAKSDVPDPNAQELPGLEVTQAPVEEADGSASREEEDPPRVHSADSDE